MRQSPGFHDIEDLEGDGSAIAQRGRQITRLGGYMTEAAEILHAVKESDDDQTGKAIDELRTVIDDAHMILKEAGELYEPVGPVYVTYGDAVSDQQPGIKTKVDECEELWTTYEGLPGDPFRVADVDDDADDSAKDDAEAEQQAKKQALENWETAASEYDSLYWSWEIAYDNAVSGVDDGMAGKIRDPNGWLDFLNGLVEVLGWIAFAVAILAIIFGGPFVALGAILAGAIFALTALQYLLGEASLGDLGWAIVGLIPIGKLGKLFKGNVTGFLGDMAGNFKPSNFSTMIKELRVVSRISSMHNVGKGTALWANGGGTAGLMSRLVLGKSPKDFTKMANGIPTDGSILSQLGSAGNFVFEVGHGMVGNMFKIEGLFNKLDGLFNPFDGGGSVKDDMPGWVDVVW